MLVYYDVQDRTDAERAAEAEPPGSDREDIRDLLTSGKLGFQFEKDTESVYRALMPTNQVENLAKAIASELPSHSTKTRLVIAYAWCEGTPTILQRVVFAGNRA